MSKTAIIWHLIFTPWTISPSLCDHIKVFYTSRICLRQNKKFRTFRLQKKIQIQIHCQHENITFHPTVWYLLILFMQASNQSQPNVCTIGSLCKESIVIGGFPSRSDRNAGSVALSWRYHALGCFWIWIWTKITWDLYILGVHLFGKVEIKRTRSVSAFQAYLFLSYACSIHSVNTC